MSIDNAPPEVLIPEPSQKTLAAYGMRSIRAIIAHSEEFLHLKGDDTRDILMREEGFDLPLRRASQARCRPGLERPGSNGFQPGFFLSCAWEQLSLGWRVLV